MSALEAARNLIVARMDEISVWEYDPTEDEDRFCGVLPGFEAEYQHLKIARDGIIFAEGDHPGMAAAERLSWRFPEQLKFQIWSRFEGESEEEEVELGALMLPKLRYLAEA